MADCLKNKRFRFINRPVYTLEHIRNLAGQMAEHNQTGMAGEELAAAFLTEKGYDILEKNWRFGHEEIDLIAKKSDVLVIAEVKTRTSNFFGEPEQFVNRQKQKRLIKAANAYVERKNIDAEVRFDIISVIISGEKKKIHHLEDAFRPVA
jgi:putative endonuclease